MPKLKLTTLRRDELVSAVISQDFVVTRYDVERTIERLLEGERPKSILEQEVWRLLQGEMR